MKKINPDVSVLIPVYNTGKTLARTLRSCTAQTLRNIEIVVVDDGSNEETKAELARCAALDPRIRVVTLPQNRGTLWVRKTLIENASGKYCMFLDSDDEFVPHACETALAAIEKSGADVLQFGTEVLFAESVPEETRQTLVKFIAPYNGELKGENIVSGCFDRNNQKFAWNLCNKIFSKQILQKVLPFVPEERCVIADDFFVSFVALCYAKKYAGIEDRLFVYHFGEGVTAAHKWTLKEFRSNAQHAVSCKALRAFVNSEMRGRARVSALLKDWNDYLLYGMLWALLYNCPESDAAAAFETVVRAYSAETVVSMLAERFTEQELLHCARLVRGCFAPPAGKTVRRVGFFDHRFNNGGIERVLSELIPMFIEWGYETVLFVEEESKDDYPLPAACKRVVLPPSSWEKVGGNYCKHAATLQKALEESGVDALLYQTHNSRFLWHDGIIARSLGIRFYVTVHGLLNGDMLLARQYTTAALKTYALADACAVQMIVRSEVEAARALGINAVYIPNPLTYAVRAEKNKNARSILWIGRLDEWQKRPSHAVAVMEQVVRRVPDAHMYFVGRGDSDEITEHYTRLIAEKGLQNNVEAVGFVQNPQEYYRNSAVLLFTSRFEGAPMVLNEALSFGLPVVSYSLPYVDSLRDNAGCTVVPQGDIDSAADEIVKILTDGDFRAETEEGARRKFDELAGFDLRTAWQEFFAAERGTAAEEKKFGVAVQTFLTCYEYGLEPPSLPAPEQAAAKDSLFKKAAKFWVERGTFALIRRGMLYVYRRLRRKK